MTKIRRSAQTPAEVVDLITQGWTVINPPTLVFEKEENSTSLEGALLALDWKPFRTKQGEWVFITDRDGAVRREFSSGDMAALVARLKHGSKEVIGDYAYSADRVGKFLHRVKTAPK